MESDEVLEVQIFNYSKYLTNRAVGCFRMVLQQLLEDGQLVVDDFLLDAQHLAQQVPIGLGIGLIVGGWTRAVIGCGRKWKWSGAGVRFKE